MPSILSSSSPEPFSSPALTGQPSPPAAQPALPSQPRTRRFGDVPTTRDAVYNRVLEAASALPPLQNTRHTLELADVHYADPPERTIAEHKDAVMRNTSMYRRLRGTWRLKDNATGNVLDQRTMTVAHIPHMTESGTFVHNGNELTISNQMRLRPGIYTRTQANGETESHVNVLPGKGVSHRYFIDPDKGVFYMRLGQAKIPLMPLLRALGADDKRLREEWGNEIFAANVPEDTPANLNKMFARLVKRVDPNKPLPDKRQAIADALKRMEVDPEVVHQTLGKPFKNLDLDAVLSTTKKLLAVSRGEADVDDRDHLAFQSVMGPEDLLAERLQKDYGGWRRQLLYKASFQGNLKSIPTNALNRQIESLFLNSGLVNSPEEINPSEIFDKLTKITRLGEGSIGSVDAVPAECYDEETEVFTSRGWVRWPEVRPDVEFGCLIDGQLEYHTASQLFAQDYSGPMYGIRTRSLDFLVTPNHRHWVQKYRGTSTKRCGYAEWQYETAEAGYRRPRTFKVSHGPYAGRAQLVADLGQVPAASRTYNPQLVEWAELVGWYIAEGSIDRYALRKRSKYQLTITQSWTANPHKVAVIDQLLWSIGVRHSFDGKKNLTFVSKQLGVWLEKCGIGARNKRIPEECFTWPVEARQRLLDGLVGGDGSISKGHKRWCFCSSSQALVKGVVRLATTLGYAVKENKPYQRKTGHYLGDRYIGPAGPQYACTALASQELSAGSGCRYDENYYIEQYQGKVYCAEVPGGKLLVRRHNSIPAWSGNSRAVQPSHLAYIDPLRSPESFRIGVDLNLARAVEKGDDGKLYSPMIDRKTGQVVKKTPQELVNSVIAFPHQDWDNDEPYVAAMHKGKIKYVAKDKVDFEVPTFEDVYSPITNLVPMKSAIQGQRAVMGSRMTMQALPLEQPEAPLVQSALPEDPSRSYEDEYGKFMGALRAEQAGTVLAVTPNYIEVQYAGEKKPRKVEIYNNFPYSRKTAIHQTPKVQPGQQFKQGDLLAYSNYTTDQNGTTALGVNARVAFVPWQGKNYEDAFVISESMAKKLSSVHVYNHNVDFDDELKVGKKPFMGLFPAKFTKQQLDTLDERGVAKPGTILNYGDPIILAAKPRAEGYHKIHKKGAASYSDITETWQHHTPGLVTDAQIGDKNAAVLVKTMMPMEEGDKMCYDGQTEVLTKAGWKRWSAVTMHDELADSRQDGEFLYSVPKALHAIPYGGTLYCAKTAQIEYAVTGSHRMWVSRSPHRYDGETFEFVRADELFGTTFWVRGYDEHGKPAKFEVRPEQQFSQLYENPVYCASVPSAVVLVRRNNSLPFWCGNSDRFGGKGIVACYDDQTEVLTDDGWKAWSNVSYDDQLAVMVDGVGRFDYPEELYSYEYEGPMYGCSTERIDYLVTPNHRMCCRIENYRGVRPGYRFRPAEDVHNKQVVFTCARHFALEDTWGEYVELPYTKAKWASKRTKTRFEKIPFFAFLGWFIAEGSLSQFTGRAGKKNKKVNSYKVQISQSREVNPENCRVIEEILDRLGLGWHYRGCQYVFSNKAIYDYLKPLGYCYQKYIPRSWFSAGREALTELLGAYYAGDGTKKARHATTTSLRLANDLQEVATLLGQHAVVRQIRKNGEKGWKNRDSYSVTFFINRPEAGTGERGRNHYVRQYKGKVYCATVPGGLLYVRRNGKPFWCGNSILPDDQMPQLADGLPAEVAQNPLGIISRRNPTSIFETILGKIAQKTGQPYKIKDWDFKDVGDWVNFVEKEMKKHGIKDLEHVIDPENGRKINDVLTGSKFYMKLHHTSAGKGQGRSTGGYTSTGEPARGGEQGSKRVALLELSGILSHGAPGVLQDASLVRGQKNEDFWLTYMQGNTPEKPKVPMVFQKFVNELKGAGINVIEEGPNFHIMALTDRNTDELAGNREITNGETVQFEKDLRPIPGGLFDPKLTGGLNGNQWSFIRLHQPMPSPVMEEPIRRLLGLTVQQFEDVLAGKFKLPNGETGPQGLVRALEQINVPRAIAKARQDIASGKRTARDIAVRKLGYLKSCQQLGIHPKDFVWSKVPVLPPVFRPVSVMEGTGSPMVADANYLYKELLDANTNLKELSKQVADTGEEQLTLYKQLKAVTGLGDPLHPKLVEKNVGGILKGIFGDGGPKTSVLQRKLISSATDMVGRGVIAPNPDLDMDSIEIPENQAWEVYRPFIVRRLKQRGMSMMEAVRHFRDQTPAAKREMLEEMQQRPVIVNRAPVLHRFGVMAFWPKLVKGDTVRTSPLVIGGFSCVGEVPILDDGRFRIVDLADFPRGEQVPGEPDTYYVPDHVQVLTHVPGGYAWAHPDRYYIHRDLEAVKVPIGRARDITVSRYHSLYVFDPKLGKCVKATPEEAVGMLTPRVAEVPQPDSPSITEIAGPNGERLPLTEELGWWFGVMAGNGWVSTARDVPLGVCVAGAIDSDVLPAWSRATENLFGLRPGIPQDRLDPGEGDYGQVRKLTVSNRPIGRWLLPLLGKRAVNKHLPEWFWQTPLEFKLGLLAGLGDTDCHIDESSTGRVNIAFTTKSATMAQQLSWLLTSLGVDNLCKSRVYNHRRAAWTVTPSVLTFGTLPLTLRNNQRAAVLKWLQENPRNERQMSNNIVPITRDECDAALAYYKTVNAVGKNRVPELFTEYAALRAGRRRGYIGRYILRKIEKRVGELSPALAARLRGREHWEKVGTPAPAGRMDMYDLHVPGPSLTFVSAYGVTVYDSGDYDGDSADLSSDILLRIRGVPTKISARDFLHHYIGVHEETVTQLTVWELQDVETIGRDGKWVPVTQFSLHPYSGPMYCVELKDGTKLRVTADHSLLVDGKEVKPTAVTPGTKLDNVLEPGTDKSTVVSVTECPNSPWVFDLTADGSFAVENGTSIHNTMQYHVPVSKIAVEQAVERMLPSKNLLSPADFKTPVYKAGQEYVGGLFAATAPPRKPSRPHYFSDVKAAVAAYKRGEIPIDAIVEVRE